MSSLKSYMDNKELRYSVTIGRKTFKGYRTAKEALAAGVAHAQNEDSRGSALLVPSAMPAGCRLIGRSASCSGRK